MVFVRAKKKNDGSVDMKAKKGFKSRKKRECGGSVVIKEQQKESEGGDVFVNQCDEIPDLVCHEDIPKHGIDSDFICPGDPSQAELEEFVKEHFEYLNQVHHVDYLFNI